MKTEKAETDCYLFVPMMEVFFRNKRKNDALVWIPVPCSLLFSDEFQQLCTQTKYIFVALMLTCGIRGKNELPFNIKYLAQISGVNRRAMSKAIEELLSAKMLTKRERKKEEKEEKEENTQHRQTETRGENADAEKAAVQCVDSENLLKSEDENQTGNNLIKGKFDGKLHGNENRSQFTIEECLRYVEICAGKGEEIKSPKALAVNLCQTGKSDAFIRAALYPEKQEEIDKAIFGAPVNFTGEPCSICFGAKMADADGKGFRACVHCKNERGKSTGSEPAGEKSDENKD